MNTYLIAEIKEYCHHLIQESRCNALPFHNWEHTLDVVDSVNTIAKAENITGEAMEQLIIAAYFHDVGYLDGAKDHEKRSCTYAAEFLAQCNYSPAFIETIKNIIMATVMPQRPNSELQNIICDADLAHLGSSSFLSKSEKLRKEWSDYEQKEYTDKEWIAMNMKFLDCHHFYTASAKAHYENGQNQE